MTCTKPKEPKHSTSHGVPHKPAQRQESPRHQDPVIAYHADLFRLQSLRALGNSELAVTKTLSATLPGIRQYTRHEPDTLEEGA